MVTTDVPPEHRDALADAIERFAEGVGENLRDDWDGDGDGDVFPYEEDLLAAADRIRAGSVEGIDASTLSDVVDELTDDPDVPRAAVAALRATQ